MSRIKRDINNNSLYGFKVGWKDLRVWQERKGITGAWEHALHLTVDAFINDVYNNFITIQ